MKRRLPSLLLALCLALAAGCVATVPLKVATTGAKLGVKTAKVGVKTTAKAGAAIMPDKQEQAEDKRE